MTWTDEDIDVAVDDMIGLGETRVVAEDWDDGDVRELCQRIRDDMQAEIDLYRENYHSALRVMYKSALSSAEKGATNAVDE